MGTGGASDGLLGAGVSLADVERVIVKSGYPLQSIAVDRVVRIMQERGVDAFAQEEWPFVDSDSKNVRQLDALISSDLLGNQGAHDFNDPLYHLDVRLDILMECKQSDLPYIFFLRPTSQRGHVPKISGTTILSLGREGAESAEEFNIGMHLFDVLGMDALPLASHDLNAVSMSTVRRRGKDLELSGEDSFRGLALPLLKATKHHIKEAEAFHGVVRLVVPVAVLRAPMVAVRMKDEVPELEPVPWVRMVRMDSTDDTDAWPTDMYGGFDVVHVDHLDHFMQIVVDTATEAVARIRRFAIPILTGRAVVLDLDADQESKDDAPYTTMRPTVTDADFPSWVREQCNTDRRTGYEI